MSRGRVRTRSFIQESDMAYRGQGSNVTVSLPEGKPKAERMEPAYGRECASAVRRPESRHA